MIRTQLLILSLIQIFRYWRAPKGEIIWIRDGEHAIVILGTHASPPTSTSHRRQELISSPPTPNTEKIESLIHRRTEESVPLLPRIIA